MKKFIVLIEGKNFLIKDEKEMFQKSGFYTTRFISAGSPSQAENIAFEIIKEDLKDITLNDLSNPPIMRVKELNEVDSFGENLVPGTGFTWFDEEQ